MNNIIVFAAYWNEIQWVKTSLSQIDKIDPIEVIICDGCFDPTQPVQSTDGTREIIQQFIKGRKNAKFIDPVRVAKIKGAIQLLAGNKKCKRINIIKPSRLRTLYLAFRNVPYRLNQALTFNHMINISKYWSPGRWFMSMDCDQFYSDDMLKNLCIVNTNIEYGLLTGDELTFFNDFFTYTEEYEKRNYNNMPHKIYSNTSIRPTRGFVLDNWSCTMRKHLVFEQDFYINKVKSKDIGNYFHYKIERGSRLENSYLLGDRKSPDISKYGLKVFHKKHPSVIQKYLNG